MNIRPDEALARLDRFVRDVCARPENWNEAVRNGFVRTLAEALVEGDASPADIELSLEILRTADDGRRLADTFARQVEVRAKTKKIGDSAKKAGDQFERERTRKEDAKRREAKVWNALDKKVSDSRIPLATALNVRRVIELDTRYAGLVRHNLLSDDVELYDIADEMWRAVRDSDELTIMYWVDEVYGISANPRHVHDALRYLADRNEVHPVEDWLRTLKWDGELRLHRLLDDYFGATPRPDVAGFDHLKQRVSRAFMISCVARAMKRPSKVDTVLVLQGEEGSFKSTALAALVPDETWFCDTLLPALKDTVEVYTQIKGTWIYEIAEIDRWTRGRPGEVEAVTAFVTGGTAKYRAKYERNAEREPRMCVFVGSTNKREFLNEDRNRRYWPFHVSEAKPDLIRRDRTQLWAEAVAAYHAGEVWHLTRAEEVVMASAMDVFKDEDPWAGLLDRVLRSLEEGHEAKGAGGILSVSDALNFVGLPAGQQTPIAASRMADVMRKMGFYPYRPRTSDGRARTWKRA
jgi:predicted P-loop ATPase